MTSEPITFIRSQKAERQYSIIFRRFVTSATAEKAIASGLRLERADEHRVHYLREAA